MKILGTPLVEYLPALALLADCGAVPPGSFTTCLLLNSILKIKPTAVPYQGTGPSMTALLRRLCCTL